MSSARKWGGAPSEYQAIHDWFDATKAIMADFRHRAARHHAEGVAVCVQVFGPTLTLSTGRVIPTRWVAEQHVREDMRGRIPSLQDWLEHLAPQKWMYPRIDLERTLEHAEIAAELEASAA